MPLFAHAPVPLWLVDFSRVRPLLKDAEGEGFEQLCARFERDRALLKRCCEAVRVVDVNLAVLDLYDVDAPEELRGPLIERISEENLDRLGIQIAAVATGRIPFRHDVALKSPDGDRTLDLLISMVDPDDWSRVIGSTVDQTDRVRPIDALRESEERFRTLAEHAPVMIDQFDADGRCVLWNRECEKRLGWSQAEIEAHPDPLSLAYPDPADRERALEAIVRADGQFREYRVHAKDGQIRDQLWADFRLPSGALISVGHDITELREAQARERELEERMWQSQKLESLGVLAGGIAHDFNNLLVGVLANADLAKSSDDPEQRDRLLDDIIESARRAAELSNQMLAYSGKATLVRERVDLTKVVRDLRPMIAAVASKKAQLRYELEPHLIVEGDVTQLRQVIFNLILNATEALGDEWGIVQVYARRESRGPIESPLIGETLPAGEYVCVEVSDDGCGMSDETVARMFDPFFTTKFTGRGLGLAAVLGIVRGHGGALEVETELGVGTTCRALFPVSEGALPEVERSKAAGPLPALRVLVVDDEPMVRKTTAILLSTDGHEVLEARDGDIALEVFRSSQPIDLVIIDATMPRMGGVEVIAELRRLDPALPIILVSGYSETLAAGIEQGRVSFLQKPYSLADLHAAMHDALKR